MADGYVDLSGVYSALNSISREINTVNNNVNVVQQNVRMVNTKVEKALSEIDVIKAQLVDMETKARFRAALQKAITEIIRVRQELESKFGAHKQVREYMLGILQASDLALISKTTISNCTEELMISAPQYWLAPCLIALAAWISDNKSLAERAVAEAVRRDEEKTCLLFALITRRINAGRVAAGKEASNVCFIWLNRYFALQDPRRMRASIIAYIDAYSNGVFGVDKEHICSEHISHWLDVLMQENPNFAQDQENYWKNFFQSRTIGMSGEHFAALAQLSPQYNDIESYISRINAAENKDTGIKQFIYDINDGVSDTQKLIADIDCQLSRLVTNYEEGEEEELRNEESLLQRIKELEGDEDRAKAEFKARNAHRQDKEVDFAERLNRSITDPNASISEKKTALSLLKGYISKAFNSFITENKSSYPESIELIINDSGKVARGRPFSWKASTINGENRDDLMASLDTVYNSEKERALAKVTDDAANEKLKKGKICMCFFIFVIPFFVGLYLRSEGKNMLRNNASTRAAIKRYYDGNKANSKRLVDNALLGRNEANEIVAAFQAEEGGEVIDLSVEHKKTAEPVEETVKEEEAL